MDAPTISIKIRGLQALEALNGNGQLAGTMKIKGANALMGLREMENNRRAIMTKKGMMMREMEMEGRRMMLQPSNMNGMNGGMNGMNGGMNGMNGGMNGMSATKGAVAKSGSTVGATMKGAAAKGAVVSGAGAASYGAKGVGWGLGLGGLGPWLALAALGLAATGIYFYMRAQQLAQSAAEDFGDPESER